jgi:hypothetical protein
MEVHHHPHVEKKGFKEYFLEFLMIFLAVTLGFFAETLREHFADKEKERKYVQSLYYDLKDDSTQFSSEIPFWQSQLKRIDTLRTEIKKGDHMNTRVAIETSLYIRAYSNFRYHDRTISQLKSSGNFRLLDAVLADSLMEYDSYITSQLRDQESNGQKIYIDVNNLQNKIFESGLFSIYVEKGPAYVDSLLKADPNAFEIHTANKDLLFEYYNALDFWQTAIHWRLYSCLRLRQKVNSLINLINKEQPTLQNEK